jgi:RHS repeat-associated protein
VFPAQAAELWAGLLDVTVDRAVLDAADGKTTVRVRPSVKVPSPFVLSLYDESTGKRVAYCSGSANAACRSSWDVEVSVPNDSERAFAVFVATDDPSSGFPSKDVSARARVSVVNVGWTGSLSVSADRAVLDAADPGAVLSVVPSIRVVAPYSLSLYDEAGKRVGYCQASNSSCRDGWDVAVSVGNYQSKTYTAFVAAEYPTSGPPSKDVRASGSVQVSNRGWVGGLDVTVDRAVVDAFDQAATVTLAPSIPLAAPYSMSLYDDQTGKRVGYCAASSAACRDGWSVRVSVPNGAERTFTGFVAADNPTSGPPSKDVRVSGSVRVVNEGWLGSLEVWVDRGLVDAADPKATVHVATTLPLVSPYALSLYDADTGKRLAYCQASNNACKDVWRTVVTIPNGQTKRYEAHVAADYPTTGPPAKDVRASGSVSIANQGWTGQVTLTADRDVVDVVDPQATISVVPSIKLVSPYVMSVYDDLTGKRVGYCSASTASCREKLSVKVTPKDGQVAVYTAYVAQDYPTTGRPVKDVRAAGSVQVTHAGWAGNVALTTPQPQLPAGTPSAVVTIAPSKKVPSPYVMSVYDDSGTRLWACQQDACRAKGGEVTVAVPPGGLKTLYAYVALTAAQATPPADGIYARAELGILRDAWSGTVSAEVDEYLELEAWRLRDGYQTRLGAAFDPPLPDGVRAGLYDDAGRRVAVSYSYPGGLATWKPVVPSPAEDRVYTVVVAPDLPEVGLPELRWGMSSVAVSGDQRRWQGQVALTAEPTGVAGQYRVTAEFSEYLDSSSVYDAWVIDQNGSPWFTCGIGEEDPVCGSALTRVMNVPSHTVRTLRAQVGHKYKYAEYVPPGVAVWSATSDPVEVAGATWEGELRFAHVGVLDPVAETVALDVEATGALPAGDKVVLFGPDGTSAAVCQTATCPFNPAVPVTEDPVLFTAAVVTPAWSGQTLTASQESGLVVGSRTVQVWNPGWSGEFAFEAVGGLDPATETVLLRATATPALPASKWIVIYGVDRQPKASCARSVCEVRLAAGQSDQEWVFTAAVMPVGDAPPSWPAGADRATASKTVGLWNRGWEGDLAVTADTGGLGVVDAADPVVNVHVSLSAPMQKGFALIACDQDGRLAYNRAAAQTAWSEASLGWTVPPETVGMLTVAVLPANHGCEDLAQARAARQISVEHVGFGGEIALTGTQPTAQNPYTDLTMALTRPLGVGYTLQVVDLADGRTAWECPADSAQKKWCTLESLFTGHLSAKPLETRRYQAVVRKIGSGADGRSWSSGVFEATHPGWQGTLTLSTSATLIHNFEHSQLTVLLSEPLGDAKLAVCEDLIGDAPPEVSPRREQHFCLQLPTEAPDQRIYSLQSFFQQAQYRSDATYQAFVYHTDQVHDHNSTIPRDNAVAASNTVHVRNDGWLGRVDLTATPTGHLWSSSTFSAPVPEVVVILSVTPTLDDAAPYAYYRRVVHQSSRSGAGSFKFCGGLDTFCHPYDDPPGHWSGSGYAYYMGAVHENTRELGYPDGGAVATSGWVSMFPPDYDLLEEYLCGVNPSVYDSVVCHGDPVSTATGEWWETAEDLAMDGAGPPLAWTRSFSTFDRGYEGTLGRGWRSNWDMSLQVAPAVAASSEITLQNAPKIRVVQENGSIVDFTKGSDGRYGSLERVRADLEQLPDGGFVFTRRDAQRFLFDSGGALTALEDENGNRVDVEHDADGRVTAVADQKGRFLQVTYDGLKVRQVADQAGRVVSYQYDVNGRLVKATSWDGTGVEYRYDGSGRVTEIHQPTGGAYLNAYDDQDRVVAQTDPAGGVTSFEYDDEREFTTITDPDGSKTREEYSNHTLLRVTYGFGTELARTVTYGYQGLIPSQVASATDDLGNVMRYTYDQDGRLLSVTDPLGVQGGYETRAFYDQAGHLAKTVDESGAATLSTFDPAGNLTSVTDAAGNTTGLTVNPDGTVAALTGPDGGVRTVGYDSHGYPVAETTPEGVTTSRTVDSIGRVLTETDPDGLTTTYGYDPHGFLTSVTGPDGLSVTYTYHPSGLPATVTDPLGNVTSYAYDTSGRVVSVTDPLGLVATYVYGPAGRVAEAKVTNPDGEEAVTGYGYDALGQLVAETDPLGNETRYGYDQVGNLTWVRSATGATTSYAYDKNGQVVSATSPAGNTVAYAYDRAGRLVGVSDPEGRYQNTTYTATGLVSRRATGQGDSEVAASWTYDASGRPLTYRDADNRVRSAVYDLDGRPVAESNPAAGATAYAYDAAGRLQAVTRPDGSQVAYAYDQLGRLASVDHPDGADDVAYAYDQFGRLAAVSDGTGYAYDGSGRVASVSGPNGTVSYAYDGWGRLARLTYPGGQEAAYAYDLAGRLTEVAGPDGGVYRYAYDQDGRVSSLAYPNGALTAYAYDPDSRVTSITTTGPDGRAVLDLGYRYTDSGLLSDVDAAYGDVGAAVSSSAAYAWDAQGRLKTVTADEGASNPVSHTPGGLVTALDTGLALAYEPVSGRPVSSTLGGAATVYGYDQLGNRVSETADGTLTREYSWDPAGNLTGAATPDGGAVAYTYDASGLLQTAVATGPDGQVADSSAFTWDQTGGVPVMLTDGQNLFVYGLGTAPIGQHPANTPPPGGPRPGGAGAGGGDPPGTGAGDGAGSEGEAPSEPSSALFLHGDLTGSIRAVTNPDGQLAAASGYTAYGQPLAASGLPGTNTVTAFGYAGEHADPATGLVYLRARWLDTATGVFLSADPADSATGDAYGYAAGNPLQLTDPSGLTPSDGWGAVLRQGARDITNTLYGAADVFSFGEFSHLAVEMGWDSEWLDLCDDAFGWGVTGATIATILVSFSRGGKATSGAVGVSTARHVTGAALKGVANAGRTAAQTGARAWGKASTAVQTAGKSLISKLKPKPKGPKPPNARVPAYAKKGPGSDGKTRGTLVRPDGTEVALVSGQHPPAWGRPPTPGMNGLTKSHVEAHAAATMRDEGLTHATLWINRKPCAAPNGCAIMLDRMVPEGSILTIHVVPEGSVGPIFQTIRVVGRGLGT